jgi:hypothetical protein
VGHREAKASWGTVVEYIERVVLQVESVGEGFDCFRQVVEGIFVIAVGGDFGESKAGEIGCDDAIAIGEEGINSRYMKDDVGKPWSRRITGASAGPASR